MFTTEDSYAPFHCRGRASGCRSTAVHMPLLAARVVPRYCRNCATITDGAVRKQLNADAEISLLPTRVLLNGALLPSQCWYLTFNGKFVYLGTHKLLTKLK